MKVFLIFKKRPFTDKKTIKNLIDFKKDTVKSRKTNTKKYYDFDDFEYKGLRER